MRVRRRGSYTPSSTAGRLATPALLLRVARCAALLFCPSADPTWDDAGAAIRVASRPCASAAAVATRPVALVVVYDMA